MFEGAVGAGQVGDEHDDGVLADEELLRAVVQVLTGGERWIGVTRSIGTMPDPNPSLNRDPDPHPDPNTKAANANPDSDPRTLSWPMMSHMRKHNC